MKTNTPAPVAGVEPKKKKSAKKPASAVTVETMVAPLLTLSDPVTMETIKAAMQQVVVNATDADLFDRELVKERAKAILKSVGYSSPATLVKAAFMGAKATGKLAGQPLLTPDPEPWPVSVDGASLLTEIRDAFVSYCLLPPHAAEALALWALRTHVMDAFDFNPILAFLSPLFRCGKTRCLEVLECLTSRAMLVSHTRPAGIYRAIDDSHPTLLLDEGDTYQRMNEDYRAILNSVHSRASAWVERQVPVGNRSEWTARKFSTYAPLAIGLIGTLPATVLDRSIVIPMKRKKSTERVALFEDSDRAALLPLKRKAIRWGLDTVSKLRTITPSVPDGLDDRAADCWRPLLAIAELAGGPWPQRACQAALALSDPEQREDDENVGIYLLRALRVIFKDTAKLPTATILDKLNADGEAPWSHWNNGRGMDAHDLAKYLKPYGVRPRTLYFPKDDWPTDVPYPKDGGAKGYEKSSLVDPWTRYLPTNNPTNLTDLTELTPQNIGVPVSASSPPTPTTRIEGYLSGGEVGKNGKEWEDEAINYEEVEQILRESDRYERANPSRRRQA